MNPLRHTFNEDDKNYDVARPGYPAELYDAVFSYMKESPAGKKAVEIGIGTGQATAPFLDAGLDVTAIELGDKLARRAAEKFRSYEHFRVILADFMDESVKADGSYDYLYAATAFHWLPKPDGYLKAKAALKSGGVIALFWNRPFARNEEDPSNRASQDVYDRLRPDGKKRVPFGQATAEQIASEIRQAGFVDVQTHLFHRIRTLTTEQYIALLNTYSDHRALDQKLKARFEKEMRESINAVGGQIRIYDTLDLYLGRKA